MGLFGEGWNMIFGGQQEYLPKPQRDAPLSASKRQGSSPIKTRSSAEVLAATPLSAR
jgi:hypothetical protein